MNCWNPVARNMSPTMIPIVLTEASSNWRIVSPTIVQTSPKTSQSHHIREMPSRTSWS